LRKQSKWSLVMLIRVRSKQQSLHFTHRSSSTVEMKRKSEVQSSVSEEEELTSISEAI